MKKVLIICDAFPPAFGPRMGYLVKYLSSFGYKAIVISTRVLTRSDNADYEHLQGYAGDVHFIDITKAEIDGYLKQQNTLIKKVKHFFKPDLNRPAGLTEKFIQFGNLLIQQGKIDIILTSTSSIFPLGAGYVLSKRYKIRWIADVRDILEQTPRTKSTIREKIVNLRIKVRRNYLIRRADIVTTVSSHHKIFLSRINSSTELIYNGYDPELFYVMPSVKESSFVITNIGHLNPDGRHNNPINIFFQAVQKCIAELPDNFQNLRIKFYTTDDSAKYILKQALKHNLLEYLDIHGFVPARDVPILLNQSSVLLMLTSKSDEKGPKGILTTELFEFIGVQRPILCVESDQSEIERIIISLDRGLAARNEREIVNFLRDKYNEWRTKGRTTVSQNNNQNIEIYSRKYQAKQFALLFDSAINA